MDPRAEQEMELEALEAILSEDMTAEAELPAGDWPAESTAYRIKVRAADADGSTGGGSQKSFDFLFAHTPSYPDEAPKTKISSVVGLSNAELEEVQRLVESEVQGNIGMAMVYTVVSALKEWLENQVAGASETVFELPPEEVEKRRREAEEAALAEARAQGTPVTPETFAAWRARWDAERAGGGAGPADGGGREKGPTGKMFFLAQDTAGVVLGEEGEEEEEEEEEEEDLSDYTDDDLGDGDEEELIAHVMARRGS